MKTKHTKGNWLTARTNSCCGTYTIEIYTNETPYWIAQVLDNTKESEANVKLIAAAPELLEIAIRFIEINKSFGFDSSKRRILRVEREDWNKLESAINLITKNNETSPKMCERYLSLL